MLPPQQPDAVRQHFRGLLLYIQISGRQPPLGSVGEVSENHVPVGSSRWTFPIK